MYYVLGEVNLSCTISMDILYIDMITIIEGVPLGFINPESAAHVIWIQLVGYKIPNFMRCDGIRRSTNESYGGGRERRISWITLDILITPKAQTRDEHNSIYTRIHDQ